MIGIGFVVANWVGYGCQYLDGNSQWRLPLGLQPSAALAERLVLLCCGGGGCVLLAKFFGAVLLGRDGPPSLSKRLALSMDFDFTPSNGFRLSKDSALSKDCTLSMDRTLPKECVLMERACRWSDMVVDNNPDAAATDDPEMEAEGDLELDALDTCAQRMYGSYGILVR